MTPWAGIEAGLEATLDRAFEVAERGAVLEPTAIADVVSGFTVVVECRR